jgi:hypothetical protein
MGATDWENTEVADFMGLQNGLQGLSQGAADGRRTACTRVTTVADSSWHVSVR